MRMCILTHSNSTMQTVGYDSASAFVKDEQISEQTIFLLQVKAACTHTCLCELHVYVWE